MTEEKKTFDLDTSAQFGIVSGDLNPVHIDPIEARRGTFGSAVAHGVHVALWGLDVALSGHKAPIELEQMSISFKRPVRVGEEVRIRSTSLKEGAANLEIGTLSQAALTVACNFKGRNTLSAFPCGSEPPPTACQEHTLEQLADLQGQTPLWIDRDKTRFMFPSLSAIVPAHQLAAILATTRIVGMNCPGRQSIFLSADITFGDDTGPNDCVAYKVRSAHPVTGRTEVELNGGGIIAKLVAGYRPLPVQQPLFSAAVQKVRKNEFQGQRAVVIGGSRGLGEVIVKLIAAGGGEVCLSYVSSRKDGERVANEVGRNHGALLAFHYDAAKPPFRLNEVLPQGWNPTHYYYMATPKILLTETTDFIDSVFANYCQIYVNGFAHLVRAAYETCAEDAKFFYPSTVAIEEVLPKAAEYASAKAAGETLCRHLSKSNPRAQILVRRLPRILTDQTNTIMPAESADPIDSMLEVVRQL